MLNRWEQRFLDGLYRVILPEDGDARLPLGASAVPLVAFTERWLRTVPWEVRVGFRLALRLVAVSPVLTGRGLRPLGRLPASEQVAVLEALGDHPVHLLRELPVLLKAVAATGYCAHPEVRRCMGYPDHAEGPPPWLASLSGREKP